jgi:hypothetical protein
MAFLEIVQAIFKPISDVIDHLTVSGDQKAALQQAALNAQVQAAQSAASYEQALLDSQTKLIAAEATGNSWLQRNWRPISALFLLGLVGAYWFGFSSPHLTQQTVDDCFSLVKICLGGYVAGRSIEKVAPHTVEVAKALRQPSGQS